MIQPHCHEIDWINAQCEKMRTGNGDIVERSIYAFNLLEGLVETGVDFVFKGGTSLLLHFDDPRRLSIDIDIVSSTDQATLENSLDGIVASRPFTRWEEQDRGKDRMPKRVHYKLFYKSPIMKGEEMPVLLDVVTEPNVIEDLVEKPITASFLEVAEPLKVMVPSANALLGDKLTAYAPNSIGVPLNENYSQQVIKQLFDVAQLYDIVSDTSAVAAANRAAYKAERTYRGLDLSYKEYLEDVIQTSHQLCSIDLRGVEETDATQLMRRGVNQIGSHLVNARFRLVQEAKVAAAKAAALATHLGQSDLAEQLPGFDMAKVGELKDYTVSESLRPMDRLKGANPEAYFYWKETNELR